MQYIAIFHGFKNDNFQIKIAIFFIIFAQNIDYGYTLEPPHYIKNKKKMYTPLTPVLLYKSGV